MKSTFAILLATTAVIGALGLPALNALVRDPGMTFGSADDGALIFASNEDHNRAASRHDSDDEDEDEDDDCDDEDEDDDCHRSAPAPAPTGPITPPANNLFSPGATPQVRIN